VNTVSEMEKTTALNIQDLSFDYGGDPVLDHVSFSIQQGDYVALIGPNGVGKTTLLKILLGILSPREGAVLLHNEPVQSYRSIERAKQIAYVSQHPALSFPLTVFELVSLGRYPHSNRFERGETDNKAIEEALALTDSAHLRDRKFTTLSGGEKQKVLISRALAQSMKILLMDEPTVHLDLYYQLQILKTLKNLCVGRQSIVIAVLHDINLATFFADKAILLRSGKIHAFGTVQDVVNEKNIQDVFGVEMTAREDEKTGSRYFLPRGPLVSK